MNHDRDPLSEALHQRAEQLHDAPVTLDDVRVSAGAIRRRRRIAAGLGTLALVAVLTPVGIATLGADDSAPPPAASDANGAAAPRADDGLAHLVGDTIVRADGTSFRPQVEGTPVTFAPVGDGRWVVQTYDEQSPSGTRIWVVDDAGAPVQQYAGGDSTLTTSDGTGSAAGPSVGWLDREGTIQVLQAGSGRPVAVGAGTSDTQLIEVRGDCDDAAGCEVLEETYGARSARTARVSPEGSEPFLDGVFYSLSDVSPDGALAAGTVSIDEFGQGSCSGVYDVDARRMLWRTCEASGLTFSPDGALVLGVDPYLDGPNHSLNVVLDARDGSVVDQRRGILFDEQWESASSWLTVEAPEGGTEGADGEVTSRIVRYTVDGGTPEEVAGPVASEIPADAAYRLQAR